MTNPTLKQVISYFKYKNILSRVEEEIKMQYGSTLEQAYKQSGEQLLNHNITWAHTAEGHAFWEKEHSEFVKFYRNQQTVNITSKILFQTKEVVRVKDELSS